MKSTAALLISLDFELLWGVRDKWDHASYGPNILGVRKAIPQILDLFERYQIEATWASVGFLFCENRDELLDMVPDAQPGYEDQRLSNYIYFDEVGKDEKDDPYYFGSSLIADIAARPGQEIGSHSFSHYYCLEPGQTVGQFDADMDAAVEIAARRGIQLKSFVFPRNQSSPEYNAVLKRHAIRAIRGNEHAWAYQASDEARQSALRRGVRLADNYINLTGHHGRDPVKVDCLTELASSRYLRPYTARLAGLDWLRLSRMTASMTAAAKSGTVYHMWWHPHDFGLNTEKNISILESLLIHFDQLRETYGMASKNMGNLA